MYNIFSFEEKANTLTEDKIKILEFSGVKKPVRFECLVCHKITQVNKGEVLLRKGKTYQCPFCHDPKEKITKQRQQEITLLANKTNKQLVSFIKMGQPAQFLCKQCNNLFSREPNRFYRIKIVPSAKVVVSQSLCLSSRKS